MGQIQLNQVTKSFGDVNVIPPLDLTIEDGEFTVFVGPSGCGKSTLLRQISGLDQPSSGAIFINDEDVTRVSAADRGLAMVFQSYALYPHMTVAQNLAFGLQNSHMPKNDIERRISEAASMLEIEPLLKRRPGQLSGGQRQRVAIGRAIVRDPTAFLLDEPLSNLDAELRVTMRAELAALHDRLQATMIYVTHDQVEAMTLADRIVVLRAGRIEQVAAPVELFDRPANRFVAGFIGAPNMNFLPLAEAGPVLGPEGAPAGTEIVGVRPQHLGAGAGGLSCTVSLIEALGTETVVHTQMPQGETVLFTEPGHVDIQRGDAVELVCDPVHLHFFNAAGQRVEHQS